MSEWRKRYEAIKRNKKNANIEDIVGVYMRLGFEKSPGKGDHVKMRHPQYGTHSVPLKTKAPLVYAIELTNVVEAYGLEDEL